LAIARKRAPTGEVLHVASSPSVNLAARGAGGQALGADMSGGPRGVSMFAKEALRPGPQVRAWRPQGPDHPQLPQPIKGEAALAAGHMHSRQRMNRFGSGTQCSSPDFNEEPKKLDA